jgi:Xaa-Pro dipeptidase
MSLPSELSQEKNLQNRQERLLNVMASAGTEYLVLNAGPSLSYLTGLNFHLSERPVIAIFSLNDQPVLIIPELESAKISNLPYETKVFRYSENPAGWGLVFKLAIQDLIIKRSRIGVEPNRLRILELRLLEQVVPDSQFISAQEIIATLRMKKDAYEISAMRKAAEIAQMHSPLPFR